MQVVRVTNSGVLVFRGIVSVIFIHNIIPCVASILIVIGIICIAHVIVLASAKQCVVH
jgi:hypothetical protein